MSNDREMPHKPAVVAIEAPATIGGLEPPNPMASYADTIQKCAGLYKASFLDEAVMVVKVISLAFGRQPMLVKRHLEQGHT